MIRRLLTRWADAALQTQVRALETELDGTKRKLSIAEEEVKTMASVCARDRARIEAETAAYNRKRANAEGIANEQLTDESVRRFSA